jgi:hypothetical protein
MNPASGPLRNYNLSEVIRRGFFICLFGEKLKIKQDGYNHGEQYPGQEPNAEIVVIGQQRFLDIPGRLEVGVTMPTARSSGVN